MAKYKKEKKESFFTKIVNFVLTVLDDAITQINTSGAYDCVIFTGDLINKPMVSELQKFLAHADNLIYPWYAVDGNHDISIDGELNKAKFRSLLAEKNDRMNQKKMYYAFTPKKGYRIICLDSINALKSPSGTGYSNSINSSGEICG